MRVGSQIQASANQEEAKEEPVVEAGLLLRNLVKITILGKPYCLLYIPNVVTLNPTLIMVTFFRNSNPGRGLRSSARRSRAGRGA